jgi:hypothetical protein
VEFHLKNVFAKLQVSSRVELILKLGQSTGAENQNLTDNSPQLDFGRWAEAIKEAVSQRGKEWRMAIHNQVSQNAADRPLTFFEAIVTCFTKFAEFNGRASRSEFWWFALFVTLVTAGLMYVSEAAANVFLVAVLLPFLAAGARRLTDCDKSRWWLLYLLVPAAGFVILGFVWALPSSPPIAADAPTPD